MEHDVAADLGSSYPVDAERIARVRGNVLRTFEQARRLAERPAGTDGSDDRD